MVFHTSEGQTRRITNRIAAVLGELGDTVEVHEVDDAPPPDTFDGVVVGDSIHAQHRSKP